MKKFIILLILILKVLAENPQGINLSFFQNDYHLIPEWFEVVSYDQKYVKEISAKVFKRTRTITAINATFNFNVELGNNFQIIGQVYKMSSNEYREFPLRMQFNACQAFAQDAGGLVGNNKCGNFTGCPIHKGRTYHICNWSVDESKLPPFLPSGRYMAEGQGLYNSKKICVCRAHYAITRPEV